MAKRPRKDSSTPAAIGIAFLYGSGALALFLALASEWHGYGTTIAAVIAIPATASLAGLLIVGALSSVPRRPIRRSRGLICSARTRSVRGHLARLVSPNLSARHNRHW